MASTQENNVGSEKQGVHFASKDQNISPEESLKAVEDVTGLKGQRDDLNQEAQQELEQLRTTLKNNIQSSRMQHHAFEPVSLPGSQPASRVSRIELLREVVKSRTDCESFRWHQGQQHQIEGA